LKHGGTEATEEKSCSEKSCGKVFQFRRFWQFWQFWQSLLDQRSSAFISGKFCLLVLVLFFNFGDFGNSGNFGNLF